MFSIAGAGERLASLNIDQIADAYRWLEYLVFGGRLAWCRNRFLDAAEGLQEAVVLGDGDGRFTAALLRAHPNLRITYVDLSPRMGSLAERRVSSDDRDRLHLVRRNATTYLFRTDLQLVASHFFLDCLTEEEVATIVRHACSCLKPGSKWLVSEFHIPVHQPARLFGQVMVSGLYLAFGWLTGLRVRRLPDYAAIMEKAGFRLQRSDCRLWGCLKSEEWILETNV